MLTTWPTRSRLAKARKVKRWCCSETLDGTTSYETRIYAYQGKIVEEYVLAENAYMPEKAIAIFDSDTFDFSYDNGLITITTDDGTAAIALRSKEGERS